jgi:glycosyltransferase involved in cell wall biosynthesis
MVGELVAYKQLDYAVRTFARNGRPLKIVGDGPEYGNLKNLAAPNIEFCGRVSDDELRDLYARSSALIVPGEEDFGITTVESLASGKPVIALGRGGSVEIVREKCGVLYDDASEAGLSGALRTFDRMESWFNPLYLRTAVTRFSGEEFNRKFAFAVNKLTGREAIPAEPATEFTTCLQTHHDTRSVRPI